MEKIFKVITYLLLILIISIAGTYLINESFFREMIKEDGIVEYTTAFLLLIISILLFVKVIKIGKHKSRTWVVFNLLMALTLFFGFGEEISWGQRIFDVSSGDFFMQNNRQKETNLHNLEINGVKLNKWIFSYALSIVFGVYFLLLLYGYKNMAFVKPIIDKFGIPVAKAKQSIVFIALTVLILAIPSSKKWELWECLFATIIFIAFMDPYNKEEKLIV